MKIENDRRAMNDAVTASRVDRALSLVREAEALLRLDAAEVTTCDPFQRQLAWGIALALVDRLEVSAEAPSHA